MDNPKVIITDVPSDGGWFNELYTNFKRKYKLDELEIDRSNLKELKYPDRSVTDRVFWVEFQNLNEELFTKYKIKFVVNEEGDGDFIWIYVDWYSNGFKLSLDKCYGFGRPLEFLELLNYLFGTYTKYFSVV